MSETERGKSRRCYRAGRQIAKIEALACACGLPAGALSPDQIVWAADLSLTDCADQAAIDIAIADAITNLVEKGKDIHRVVIFAPVISRCVAMAGERGETLIVSTPPCFCLHLVCTRVQDHPPTGRCTFALWIATERIEACG